MVQRTKSSVTSAALADIREQLQPELGTKGTKAQECSDCGQTFIRTTHDDRRYCPSCGASRQLSAGEQMSQRIGPVYARAVLGQLAHWTAEAQRLGLTTDP